jgi:hypothetical protein
MDGVYKNNILAHLLPFSSLIFCISLEDIAPGLLVTYKGGKLIS